MATGLLHSVTAHRFQLVLPSPIGLLDVTMTKQHLDGAQVSAGCEWMRCKAQAQSVGMDVLVFEAGAFGGLLTGAPEKLSGDRTTRR
jgi:hypothetical protein